MSPVEAWGPWPGRFWCTLRCSSTVTPQQDRSRAGTCWRRGQPDAGHWLVVVSCLGISLRASLLLIACTAAAPCTSSICKDIQHVVPGAAEADHRCELHQTIANVVRLRCRTLPCCRKRSWQPTRRSTRPCQPPSWRRWRPTLRRWAGAEMRRGRWAGPGERGEGARGLGCGAGNCWQGREVWSLRGKDLAADDVVTLGCITGVLCASLNLGLV